MQSLTVCTTAGDLEPQGQDDIYTNACQQPLKTSIEFCETMGDEAKNQHLAVALAEKTFLEARIHKDALAIQIQIASIGSTDVLE